MIFFSVTLRYQPTIIEDALGLITVPIKRSTSNVTRSFRSNIDFLLNLRELEEENNRLKKENIELAFQVSRLSLLEEENKKLYELLEMNRRYPEFITVGAQVIGNDISNWSSTFVIDKGRRDGVTNNMVILGNGGLAGRVIESGYSYSKVIPIIDESSSVSVKSVRTGDTGMLRGGLQNIEQGSMKIDLINIDSEIMEGDEIITSGLGRIFPPGLVVGHITEVGIDDNGLTMYALMKPVVDFDKIESVLIIKGTH
jgi:rod shape-determining protein MreC